MHTFTIREQPRTDPISYQRFSANELALCIIIAAAFGVLAVVLGQDANWDLLNYHYYDPFALVHGRLDYDMAPAQVQTFHNPLLHLPFYYAVNSLPPVAVGFLLGTFQGLNFVLLYAIARCLIHAPTTRLGTLYAALIALSGMLGAANLSEIGTTMADNVVSVFVLGSLFLVIAGCKGLLERNASGLAYAAAAGALMGLAVGLKQTTAIYGLGLCAAMLSIAIPWSRRIQAAFIFGVGVLGGLAMTGGFWFYELWERFGNPTFPYFNRVFQSPWVTSQFNLRDERFLPRRFYEWLTYPLVCLFDPSRTAELTFRDLRIPLLYVLAVTLGVAAIVRRRTATLGSYDSLQRSRLALLMVFGIVTYVVWLKLFSIYRYLIVTEMLAPLGIWLLAARLVPSSPLAKRLTLLALLGVTVTVRPPNWGRVSWDRDYFGVQVPVLPDPEHSLVLMTGYEPTAYVIPAFPAAVRFVRIQSNFTRPDVMSDGYRRRIQRAIAENRGPLYALFHENEATLPQQALAAYGLSLLSDRCQTIRSHIQNSVPEPMRFCEVVRSNPAGNQHP